MQAAAAAAKPTTLIVPVIDEQYGPIQPSEEYLQELQALVHSQSVLQKSGYILSQFAPSDLNRKRRCDRCCRQLPNKFKKLQWLPKATVTANPDLKGLASTSGSSSSPQSGFDKRHEIEKGPRSESTPKKPFLRCKYHPGRVAQKKWTCCNGNVFSPPCKGDETHRPKMYAQGELEKEWKFFPTPPFKSKSQPAVAVVIDCEMGTSETGESELIRVSVVDYFTRAVLFDSLVYPDVKMAHYNTRFSGVTKSAMEDAKRRRSCIFGRNKARETLWQFVGPETIVIGHACHQDLSSLRWIHPVVVDTLIIETSNRPPVEKKDQRDEEGQSKDSSVKDQIVDTTLVVKQNEEKSPEKAQEKGGGLSLKALSLIRLNRAIQIRGQGHDSVEDSIATRDILHWNVSKLVLEKASNQQVA